ncbi:hypothetical protein [Subtercola sp. YIM 133946]|uniref:hypothetical protein n=1 Tax=Subtercola sp. YIM 133946 TaxID=3118909 RepID=UPI002F92F00B
MEKLQYGFVAMHFSRLRSGTANEAQTWVKMPGLQTGRRMGGDALLAIIYRGRPDTVAELAALSHLGRSEARAAVDDLRLRGLLGGVGEELVYTNPAFWAAEAVSARSAELRRTAAEALADLENIVTELPEMLRYWAVGEASDDPVPVVIRHGPHASEDLWFDTVRHDTGTLNAVLPQVDRFAGSSAERAERFGQALAGKDAVRVIMPTWAADDADTQPSTAHYGSVGVEYRLMDTPPSWFWVDGEQLAVPFEWGEGRPTSVLGVRNVALAGMARAYFECLWQLAEPVLPAENSWSPLLRLMRQGVTLDTASRRIGIAPRTGRRRIAAAMAHYGVSTLFALGVAWAADGSTTPTTG